MLKQLTIIAVKQLLPQKKAARKGKLKLPPWVTVLAIGLLMCASFYVFFEQFAQAFYGIGLGWVYFSLVGSFTFTMLLIIDISMIQGQLYESTHNDVLLAMPIKTTDILISRLISILLYNYMFELVLLGPGMAAWIVTAGKVGTFLPAALVIALFWPLLPMAISCIVGYVLNRITAKLQHKNTVKIVLTFAFLAVYYYFTFTLQSKLADLESSSDQLIRVFGAIKLGEWYGKGIMHTNIKYIMYIIGLCIVAGIVSVVVLNHRFIYIITNSSGVISKKAYKEKPVRERSLHAALWYRELRRLGAYYTYMINSLMPIIFLLAGAVILIIKGSSIIDLIIGESGILYDDVIYQLVATIIIGMACLMCTTYTSFACQISIEGRSFEHLKSLPISYNTILNNKLLFHYFMMGPLLLLISILTCINIKMEPLMFIGVILLPQVFVILVDEIGMFFNLVYPRLDWTNDAQVVKRGAAVFITMFGSLAVGAAYILVFILLMNQGYNIDAYTYMMILSGVTALIDVVLYLIIIKYGNKRLTVIGGE